jgi:hypothetical protein
MGQLAVFRQNILAAGVLDPTGVHHAFAYGTHGQKVDFGNIQKGSSLYDEWVAVTVGGILRRTVGELPLAVLGIANGTNQLAEDVAEKLEIQPLYTRKTSPREVTLTDESRTELAMLMDLGKTGLVIGLEDVGTSGGTALSGAESVRQAGLEDVEVLFTWKRTEELTAFVGSSIAHNVIIDEPLPTYSPEECAVTGFCAQGWQLIPHVT